MRWLDLTGHDVALRPRRLPSGAIIVVLEGAVGEQEAQRLHFRRSAGGAWFSTRYTGKDGKLRTFRLSEFAEVYPNARIREMTLDEVLGPKEAPSPHRASAAQVVAGEYKLLGTNHLGEEVGEDPLGRFARKDETVVREGNVGDYDSRFLRGGTSYRERAVDLTMHVYGYVRGLAAGGRGDSQDIGQLCEVLFGMPGNQGERFVARAQRDVEAAIEVAAARLLRRVHARGGDDHRVALEAAAALDTRLPRLSQEAMGDAALERGFTPLLAQAAARWVRTENRQVLLPYAANGMVAGFLHQAADINILLPRQMRSDLDRFGELLGEGVRVNPFDPERDVWAAESADVLMMAPRQVGTQGALDGQHFEHPQFYEAARALVSIPHHGEAVLLFVGQDGDLQRPLEQTQIHPFLTWAATHYRLDDVMALDAGVVARPGDARPAWLVKIAGRRWTAESRPVPEVDRVYTRDELVERLAAPVVRDAEAVAADGVSAVLTEFNRQFDEADQVVLNDYQRPYVALASYDTPTLAVPKHLVRPTREALNRFARRHGTVEQYLERELGWSAEDLAAHELSVEQADALALSLVRMRNGGEFVLGDHTGTGKGRIIAAHIKAAIDRGEIPTFVTKSTDLFSDLWRDLRDIGVADDVHPLVVDNTVVYDMEGREVTRFERAKVDYFIEHGKLPPGVNLLMCTHLGLSKASPYLRTGSADKLKGFPAQRAKAVVDFTAGRPVLLDESHMLTGDGAFGQVAKVIKKHADAVLDASATYVRDPRGLASYARVLPDDIKPEVLIGTVRRGGSPLQEVVSQMLVADGRMVRREQDFSNLNLQVIEDAARLARNERITDQVAAALGEMRDLGETVRRVVDDALTHKGMRRTLQTVYKEIKGIDKAHVGDMGFASFYHLLANQFTVAMKQELMVEEALSALANGEKPVVVVEHNGGELHKDLLDPKEDGIAEYMTPGSYPDIKDVLRRRVHRICHPKICDERLYDDKGRRTKTVRVSVFAVLQTLGAEDKEKRLRTKIDECLEAIAQIENLGFAPLDYVREQIEQAGYRVGEISGRTQRVVRTAEGARLEKYKKLDRAVLLRQFNEGELDALVGTGAMTTGNSMHADRRYSDRRRRVAIEAQLMGVISERIQLLGRFDRRGQVVAPRLLSLSSALPTEARLMAMSNHHLKQLSASVTSNRNAPQAIPSYDLFNRFGDKAVMRVLGYHPEAIDAMMLTEGEVDRLFTEREPGALARAVTGAMMLLPVAEQRALLKDFDSEHQLVLNLEQGELGSGVAVGELDLRARTERRAIYKGKVKTHYDSEFDKPVEIAELSYRIAAAQLHSAAKVYKEVEHLFERGQQTGIIDSEGRGWPDILAMLEDNEQQLRTRYEEQIRRNQNAIGARDTLASFLLRDFEVLKKTLPLLVPGAVLPYWNSWQIVVAVTPPASKTIRALTNPQAYEVRYLDLLNGKEEQRPLSWVLNHDIDFDTIERLSEHHPAYQELDWIRGHTRAVRRVVLQGNLFEAARLAHRHGLGRPVVYTDQKGARHRAILCPSKTTWADLMRLPVPFARAEQALAYLLSGLTTELQSHSRAYEPRTSLRLRLLDGRVELSAPAQVLDGGTMLGKALLYREPGAQIEAASKARNKVVVGPATIAALLGEIDTLSGDGLFIREKEADGVRQRAWMDEYDNGKTETLEQLLQQGDMSGDQQQAVIDEALAMDFDLEPDEPLQSPSGPGTGPLP